MNEEEELMAALADNGPFDAAIHCAGRASDVGRDREFRSANYLAVLNLIKAMPVAHIRRLVHISTTDVYGIRDFQNADEATPFYNNLRNPYPKYKILAERAIVKALSPEQYVILRPAAVWGRGDTTILPRILGFLQNSPYIVHFGKWRGQNRWPLAHVGNVAMAAYLGASCDDALGEAYNVLDPERTSIEEYYRMILQKYLPEKSEMKSVTLPLPVGWVYGSTSSLLSSVFNLKQPLFDPSLYGLYSVCRNLDFSSHKLEKLFDRHGQVFVKKDFDLD
jgi:nucleoside-diphosphate-sugar epimerase